MLGIVGVAVGEAIFKFLLTFLYELPLLVVQNVNVPFRVGHVH
jgi:hypothetical protein